MMKAGADPNHVHSDKSNGYLPVEQERVLRMESVLYAFAVKFLTKNELNSLEEVFRMTELGRLLEERGKKIGKEIGKEQVNQLNRKLLSQNRTEDMIRSLNDEEYQKRLFKEFGI